MEHIIGILLFSLFLSDVSAQGFFGMEPIISPTGSGNGIHSVTNSNPSPNARPNGGGGAPNNPAMETVQNPNRLAMAPFLGDQGRPGTDFTRPTNPGNPDPNTLVNMRRKPPQPTMVVKMPHLCQTTSWSTDSMVVLPMPMSSMKTALGTLPLRGGIVTQQGRRPIPFSMAQIMMMKMRNQMMSNAMHQSSPMEGHPMVSPNNMPNNMMNAGIGHNMMNRMVMSNNMNNMGSTMNNMAPMPEPNMMNNMAPMPEPNMMNNMAPMPEPNMMNNMAPMPNVNMMNNMVPMPEPNMMNNMAPMPEPNMMNNMAPMPESNMMNNMAPMPNVNMMNNMVPMPEPNMMNNMVPMPEPNMMNNMAPMPNVNMMNNMAPMPEPNMMNNMVPMPNVNMMNNMAAMPEPNMMNNMAPMPNVNMMNNMAAMPEPNMMNNMAPMPNVNMMNSMFTMNGQNMMNKMAPSNQNGMNQMLPLPEPITNNGARNMAPNSGPNMMRLMTSGANMMGNVGSIMSMMSTSQNGGNSQPNLQQIVWMAPSSKTMVAMSYPGGPGGSNKVRLAVY